MINGISHTRLMILLLFFAMTKGLLAVDGDPVAVRNWPGGVVSVETQWNLHLVIDPEGNSARHLEREPDHIVSPSDDLDHYLLRKPNSSNVSWLPAADMKATDANAVHVQTVHNFGEQKSLQIEVDGIQIVYVPANWFISQQNLDSITINLQDGINPDLLILDAKNIDQLTAKGTGVLLRFVKPKKILLNRINVVDDPNVELLRNRFGREAIVALPNRNTIALSAAESERALQVFATADTPWVMPTSLARLFAAMEKANQNSQDVFAKLSANQMNFKPANGTHTPRWNSEHMMGRQLLFFSQIYHAQNPVISVMDLNPEQMPPDYVFAHPDWDGPEEARQMRRVSDFTRRFAYLLEAIDLDKKAPGSRWTLRGLLKQMERHYAEHTANTIKKFDLPDWPKK